jgi:hypothetical protein
MREGRMSEGEFESVLAFRGIPHAFRTAYEQGGIEGLYESHVGAVRSSFLYRFLYQAADLLLPITALFEIAKEIDRIVGEEGVASGSKSLLERLSVPWQADLPADARETLLEGSVIFYGLHGSALTPALLAAALGRKDLKMIGASYIATLGPHLREVTFPVYASASISVKAAGRTGLVPRLVAWLANKLDHPIDRETAKTLNRASLARGSDHVRSGGGLLIAPDPREPGDKWRPGIGALVANLASEPAPAGSYLVPWFIDGASITGVFQLLSRNPLWRRAGRRRFRRSVRVGFGDPIRVERLVEATGTNPARITEALEADYFRRAAARAQ